MKEIGKMQSLMDGEFSLLRMATNMKEILRKDIRLAQELSPGIME